MSREEKYQENNNNVVELIGEIKTNPEFSHEVFGERFFEMKLDIKRYNIEHSDEVSVVLSEKLIELDKLILGTRIQVNGQFRSYNKPNPENEKKSHLVLSVFCKDIDVIDDDEGQDEEEKIVCKDENYIALFGFICKEPLLRKTPSGRDIADVLIAVNRAYGKTDYIPCICWGRDAKFIANRGTVGTHVSITGRIQSREYKKKLSDGTYSESKTVYEVSSRRIDILSSKDI